MTRQTLKANYLNTICWFNNTIVDWGSAGTQYLLDGTTKQLYPYHYTLPYAGAITSADGRYNFIYTRLGTKGLLLREGKLLREVNRSYYCANVHEYPAIFVTIDNTTYLIHCPLAYDRLDLENVETGELVTNIPGRGESDFFHSRLEISPNGTYLMSRGWFWHPRNEVQLFNINECMNNPLLLDKYGLYPNVGSEICTASFISDSKVLIGSGDEVFDDGDTGAIPVRHLAIWDLAENKVWRSTAVDKPFGNLFAIDKDHTWDMFDHPKIINIHTGKIVDERRSINSGKRNSAICHNLDKHLQIAFNRETKQIAISGKNKIEILTPTL